MMADLQKLADMKAQGLLTDEEFAVDEGQAPGVRSRVIAEHATTGAQR